MIFETQRLLLRPWTESDAADLYELAKDPRVGPIAGWPIHTSVENSRQIIRDVLCVPDTYAVTCKPCDTAVGSIGLMTGEQNNIPLKADEAEIGYWIGVAYWGQGLIPEAVRELMRYAFCERGMSALWCGYFEGNDKSKRVQEKCGFQYHHTIKDAPWPLMGDVRTEHITRITKDEWQQR